MKLWVGVTDNDWFDFQSRAGVDEVNIWQPSSRAPIVGLEPGSPFMFKLNGSIHWRSRMDRTGSTQTSRGVSTFCEPTKLADSFGRLRTKLAVHYVPCVI